MTISPAQLNAIKMMTPGEEEAIANTVAFGHAYGYGYLIGYLQRAWSKMLKDKHSLPTKVADEAAGIICPWCKVDRRTGRK